METLKVSDSPGGIAARPAGESQARPGVDTGAGLRALAKAVDLAAGAGLLPADVTASAWAALAGLTTAADELLPVAEVAKRLHVSVDSVRRLIGAGDLVAFRLGYRTMRVPVGALAGYLAGRATGLTAA